MTQEILRHVPPILRSEPENLAVPRVCRQNPKAIQQSCSCLGRILADASAFGHPIQFGLARQRPRNCPARENGAGQDEAGVKTTHKKRGSGRFCSLRVSFVDLDSSSAASWTAADI